MHNSKFSKKRIKTEGLLSVISRYQFLLFSVIGQIYLLLLISVPAEFHGILGVSHTTLINVVSLVSIVIFAVLLTMQWTYPMSNEVPLIIVMIWILLSTQASSYCICCGPTHPHSHHIDGGAGAAVEHQQLSDGKVVVQDYEEWEDDGGDEEDDGDHHHHHHHPQHNKFFLFEIWDRYTYNCNKEAFYFVYSILSVILLASSIFSDLRNYYISLLNRMIVIILIFTLIVLLVVSPVSCSQFNIVDNSFIILRITIYHILWFMNHYKGLTERILEMNYSNGLQIATHTAVETVSAMGTDDNSKTTTQGSYSRQQSKRLKIYAASQPTTTPSSTLKELDRVGQNLVNAQNYSYRNLAQSNGARKKKSSKRTTRRRREEMLLPMSDDDDASESESESEDYGGGGRTHNLVEYVGRLVKLNRYYYSGSWTGSILSWKNRNYNKNILRIVDMTRTLWVLAVSPYWLLPLVPIQIIWLLYHIRKNTSELLEAYKITEILSYEFNNKNK